MLRSAAAITVFPRPHARPQAALHRPILQRGLVSVEGKQSVVDDFNCGQVIFRRRIFMHGVLSNMTLDHEQLFARHPRQKFHFLHTASTNSNDLPARPRIPKKNRENGIPKNESPTQYSGNAFPDLSASSAWLANAGPSSKGRNSRY